MPKLNDAEMKGNGNKTQMKRKGIEKIKESESEIDELDFYRCTTLRCEPSHHEIPNVHIMKKCPNRSLKDKDS